MKEQFVTYEIALKLKELGFDEDCFAHYCNGDLITKTAILKSSTMLYYRQDNINPYQQYAHENCTAPLWQQAIDWLLEKHKVDILFERSVYPGYRYQIYKNFHTKDNISLNSGVFDNPHKAREQAILKALELCQNN